jgi:hypothetical protein
MPKLHFTVATLLIATAWVATSCLGIAVLMRWGNVDALPMDDKPLGLVRVCGAVILLVVGVYMAVETLLGRSRQGLVMVIGIAYMFFAALALVLLIQALMAVLNWIGS